MWVEGRVTDTHGVPLAGGTVEIWQCDASGHYHHPGDGGKAAQAFQGFGRVQMYVAGDPGNARDSLWRRLGEAERAALTVPFDPSPDGMRAQFALVVLT